MVLLPSEAAGQEPLSLRQPPPRLVKARPGDTPATLARRYLADASRGWMIAEYNDKHRFAPGEAVLIPQRPFRRGGLYPQAIQAVPVLAYGDIGGISTEDKRLTRAAFRDQMQWLAAHGFSAITPDQLIDFMAFRGQLPRKAVLITADTEAQSFAEQALPVLDEYGFTATLFIASENLGRPGTLRWHQVRRLRADGFTIGCRGRNGRSLLRRKQGQSFETNFNWIASELRQAKKKVEAELGEPCRYLAYPEGRSSSLLAAMAASVGFSAAFNQMPGSTPFFADRFSIHRNRIDAPMAADRFSALLASTLAVDPN